MENKIYLIHWNAQEAEEHAQRIRQAGWEVDWEAKDGARAGKAIRESLPRAVVIYLSRLPSHGRETADYLHSLKATRQIPIVFVDGQGEALEKTKAKVQEAIYITSDELETTLNNLLEEA